MSIYFRSLHLYIRNLETQRDFFKKLGYPCSPISKDSFSTEIGRSSMIFHLTEEYYEYHYCILIDKNQFQEKRNMLSELQIDLVSWDGNELVRNEAWDSDSWYFYDPNGGMPEFIVHHSIEEKIEEEQLAEVAMAVNDTVEVADTIFNSTGLKAFKATGTRFLDIGEAGTMFILIDPIQKPEWFPYALEAKTTPCHGSIMVNNVEYHFKFEDGKIEI